MIRARELIEDTLPLTVRLGETDQEEPVLLYRVPLEGGGDRVLARPTTGRSSEYLVSN
jgi:hypothetical protein